MSALKPAAQRQRRNARPGEANLIPIDGGLADLPEPTKTWTAGVVKEWHALWSSPLALAFLPASDEPALRRLFDKRSDRERFARAFKRTPWIEGSTGQQKLNPLSDDIHKLDAEILALEDRFGLNPSSRLKLGVTFGKAKEGFDAMGGADDDDDDDGTFDGL